MEINVVETTRAVPFSKLCGGDIFRFADKSLGIWMKTGHCDDDSKGVVIVNLDSGFTAVVKFKEGHKTLVEKAKSTSMTVEF